MAGRGGRPAGKDGGERRGARRGDDRRPSGADEGRPPHRPPPHPGLSRSDRGPRPEGSGAAQRDRDESGGAGDRGRPGRRAQGEGPARASSRHPDPHQGQPRHGGPDDDDRGLAGPGGIDTAPGLVRRPAAAGGGGGAPRQGQPQRVGEHPLQPLVERMERARGPVPQPLRPRPQPLRIQLRLGIGRLREPLRGGHRHRDRRLHRVPLQRQRARGDQADPRPGEPRGDHPHRAQPGYGGPSPASIRAMPPPPTRDAPRRSMRLSSTRPACAAPASGWRASSSASTPRSTASWRTLSRR